MKKILLIGALAIALTSSASESAIEVGMPEAQLLQLKGQPGSKLSSGSKSIYQWTDLSVTIRNGKVESFKKIDPSMNMANEAARARAEMVKKQEKASVTERKKSIGTTAATGAPTEHDAEDERLTSEINKKSRIVALENEIRQMESTLDADDKRSSFKGPPPMPAEQRDLIKLRLEKARRDLRKLK